MTDWTVYHEKTAFLSSLSSEVTALFFNYTLFFPCVSRLSHSFGKNSSWIVFLEEETNVKMTKLLQVLAKFDKNKVRK